MTVSIKQVEAIANRHVARCLTRIEVVHDMPEACREVVRKEMHFCAQDVVEAIEREGGVSNAKEINGNR